jgi:tetraacyldisaccharide 4'-kinase
MYIRILLRPLAVLYGFVVSVRNYLYDKQILKSHSVPVKTIGVGNIRAGGTGKTPHSAFLIQALRSAGYNPGFVSRGYGRKETGIHLVTPEDTAARSGDEPVMLARMLPHLPAAVSASRVEGVAFLLSEFPSLDSVVLDDVFQHRSIKTDCLILLLDYNDLINNSMRLIPEGLYRETPAAIHRADIVILTRSPENPDKERVRTLISSVKPGFDHLFYSKLRYNGYLSSGVYEPIIYKDETCILITGIARPEDLISEMERFWKKVIPVTRKDHYNYEMKDIEEIQGLLSANPGACLLTTAKDDVRLKTLGINCSVISIEPDVENKDKLINQILEISGLH